MLQMPELPDLSCLESSDDELCVDAKEPRQALPNSHEANCTIEFVMGGLAMEGSGDIDKHATQETPNDEELLKEACGAEPLPAGIHAVARSVKSRAHQGKKTCKDKKACKDRELRVQEENAAL